MLEMLENYLAVEDIFLKNKKQAFDDFN